jgi:hypothetical protein
MRFMSARRHAPGHARDREVITDAQGLFSAPLLSVGANTVKADLSGLQVTRAA